MEHRYVTDNGETIELTTAIVTAGQFENKIIEDKERSTEHITYWRKVAA